MYKLMVYHQGDKMNNNIKVNITEPVNFRLNNEMIANLKRIARHVSYHLDQDYTYIDLIRCLLAEHFCVPDTSDISDVQLKTGLELCSKIDKQAAAAGIAYIPVTFTSSGSTFTTTTVFNSSKRANEDADKQE